ncbi:hypothetical protein LAZ67_X003624 [Cordylochernes scorpioides]|uniref:Uncharacterized protein n=1 Tax=Cordylochernes scorpioides TaxID=51811 RepID=A0ABY6LVA2_9ARAC|nr:hypothetical protein LAZ67_X003624 [Cordylochernes scorpioides]
MAEFVGITQLDEDSQSSFIRRDVLQEIKIPISKDRTGPTQMLTTFIHYNESTDEILRRFWEIEEVPPRNELTKEERFCKTIYQKEVRRMADGRFVVPLPFDPEVKPQDYFVTSLNPCIQRQVSLEQCLSKDSEIRRAYCDFMNEYERLGHVNHIDELPSNNQDDCYSLSHRAVVSSQQATKIVVFDASSKTSNGFSLNDQFYTGPKFQKDILNILMNCKQHKVIFTADIEKMYRQILTRCYDIWHCSCSILAIRTLTQLAKDERLKFPRATMVLMEDTYVNDVITDTEIIWKNHWTSKVNSLI